MNRALLLVFAVIVAGCGDSNGPEPYAAMQFTFRGSTPGSASGTLDVKGRREPYATNSPTGAIGTVTGAPSTGEMITIVGSRADGVELEFQLIRVSGPGLMPMCPDFSADPIAPSNCITNGHFFHESPSYPYYLKDFGTDHQAAFKVTVSELTRTRIRGTFEGITIGRCYGCAAQYINVPDTMRISAGSFDVPYR